MVRKNCNKSVNTQLLKITDTNIEIVNKTFLGLFLKENLEL